MAALFFFVSFFESVSDGVALESGVIKSASVGAGTREHLISLVPTHFRRKLLWRRPEWDLATPQSSILELPKPAEESSSSPACSIKQNRRHRIMHASGAAKMAQNKTYR
jgi:hypothetical protein